MKTNWSDFWYAALVRALRTLAQTAVATVGTSALIEAVNWRVVASASLSVLTSVATGLPEAERKGAHEK